MESEDPDTNVKGGQDPDQGKPDFTHTGNNIRATRTHYTGQLVVGSKQNINI